VDLAEDEEDHTDHDDPRQRLVKLCRAKRGAFSEAQASQAPKELSGLV